MNILKDIERIRTLAARFMLDTCEIRTRHVTTVKGEVIETWDNGTVIPCRFITRSNSTQARAQNESSAFTTVIGMYGLQVPFDTVIAEGDRVQYNNHIYSVVYVPTIHAYTGACIVGINRVG